MKQQPREWSSGQKGQSLHRNWRLLLSGLILLAVLIGVLVGDDYGMSVDEPDNAYVGGIAARALVSSRAHTEYLRRGVEIAHHGPSYFMVWEGGSQLLHRLAPGWHIADAHHLLNYLIFLLGLAIVYTFARRLLDRKFALLTTLLAGTQPLLFGHALINQKDTPFWVFFLASVVVGLRAVDRLLDSGGAAADGEGPTVRQRLASDWDSASPVSRWLGLAALAVGLAAALDLIAFERGLAALEGVIRRAHSGEALPFVNQLYRAFAEDAGQVSVAVYLKKIRWPYWLLRAPLIIVALLLSALGFRSSFPGAFRRTWRRYGGHLLRFVGAGALLGFTLSIRSIGLFAGGLVGLYWLLKGRLRKAGFLLPYGLTAGLATYLTWPYLWPAPYQRFLRSLLFTGNLEKDTLYWGRVIRSDSLPWHYFPSYLGTELTEPAILLIALGLGMAVWHLLRPGRNRATLSVILTWIVAPLGAFLAVGGGVYGNIRHLLFVVIPLLILAGVAMERLSSWLRRELLLPILSFILLAPGVIGMVRLHPYQYAYFNAYVGGVSRAADLHILDRWCTSYREAMAYINEDADTGAVVTSMRNEDVARPFAREDVSFPNWSPSLLEDADYILTCGFQLGILSDDPSWDKVHQVERLGAVFAEVYRRDGVLSD